MAYIWINPTGKLANNFVIYVGGNNLVIDSVDRSVFTIIGELDGCRLLQKDNNNHKLPTEGKPSPGLILEYDPSTKTYWDHIGLTEVHAQFIDGELWIYYFSSYEGFAEIKHIRVTRSGETVWKNTCITTLNSLFFNQKKN